MEFGDTLERILKEAKRRQQQEKELYSVFYHKHYVQTREIKGIVHWQIYTDAYTENGILSSRTTKGKFMQQLEPSQPKMSVDFVCGKPGGELMTPQSLKYLNKLIRKNLPDIEQYHFHCLRHTYATTLINNGANMKNVQMLMGHSDIKITMNTYSHATDDSRREAVDILEQVIS